MGGSTLLPQQMASQPVTETVSYFTNLALLKFSCQQVPGVSV